MSEARESAVVDVGASTVFNSVGIDVGSSTTHLILSRLVVGRRDSHFHRKPEVLERRTIYRSPVIFTPFLDDSTIDHNAVLAFVQGSYREAGMPFEEVSTGAVICTGEAARRKNAQVITRALAKDSGKFVCATAGHHFEAMLAAHGSGSVELSHYFDGAVVNLDIGGGTSKRALMRDGAIQDTAAINVGARLVVFDADGTVRRAEPAGRAIAATLGIDVAWAALELRPAARSRRGDGSVDRGVSRPRTAVTARARAPGHRSAGAAAGPVDHERTAALRAQTVSPGVLGRSIRVRVRGTRVRHR